MTISIMDFQFFPEYYIPFVLLILVMYLETFKTLLQVIKRKKHLYLFFHFLILSFVAFGFSMIDIVDYKKLDENILSNNPVINLPKSFYHENDEMYKRNQKVHFRLTTDENDELVIFYEGYKKVGLEEIHSLILTEQLNYPDYYKYRMLVNIAANDNLKLKHIKIFEAEIYSIGKRKVRYDVLNEDVRTYRFTSYGFNKHLNSSILEHKVDYGIPPLPPLPIPEYLEGLTFKDTISIIIDNEIKFNNHYVKENNLVKLFEKEIDSSTLFLYEINIETSYQNYITLISAHNRAVYNLRQKNTILDFDFFKRDYRLTEEEKQELNRLKEQFPIYQQEIYLNK